MARPRGPARNDRVREATSPRYAAEPSAESLVGVLLDSDVIIEILRGRSETVRTAERLEQNRIPTYISPVAWAEIFAGIRPKEVEVAEEFFHARGEVVLDGVAGRRAGSYLARYGRSHGVQIADALVAAAATTSGLLLWTLNRRHYPMPELQFFESST
jgi:predicted nucleic acid-binding protein